MTTGKWVNPRMRLNASCDMQILGTNQSETFARHECNLSQIIPNADLCQWHLIQRQLLIRIRGKI